MPVCASDFDRLVDLIRLVDSAHFHSVPGCGYELLFTHVVATAATLSSPLRRRKVLWTFRVPSSAQTGVETHDSCASIWDPCEKSGLVILA